MRSSTLATESRGRSSWSSVGHERDAHEAMRAAARECGDDLAAAALLGIVQGLTSSCHSARPRTSCSISELAGRDPSASASASTSRCTSGRRSPCSSISHELAELARDVLKLRLRCRLSLSARCRALAGVAFQSRSRAAPPRRLDRGVLIIGSIIFGWRERFTIARGRSRTSAPRCPRMACPASRCCRHRRSGITISAGCTRASAAPTATRSLPPRDAVTSAPAQRRCSTLAARKRSSRRPTCSPCFVLSFVFGLLASRSWSASFAPIAGVVVPYRSSWRRSRSPCALGR